MILDDTRTSANAKLDFRIETTFSYLRHVSLTLVQRTTYAPTPPFWISQKFIIVPSSISHRLINNLFVFLTSFLNAPYGGNWRAKASVLFFHFQQGDFDSRRWIWRFDRFYDFWYFVEGSTNSAERKKYEFKVLISFPVVCRGRRRRRREYKIFAKFSPYSGARIIIPWLGQFSRLSTISVLKGKGIACICIPLLKHSSCW